MGVRYTNNKVAARTLLKIVATLCLIGIFVFVFNVKHYPFWWWFMPAERKLCDNYDRTEATNLTCYYVIRQWLYRYKIERLHSNPELIVIRSFLPDVNAYDWLLRFTREHSEPSPVYTLLTDSELEKKIMKILDFRTSNSIGYSKFFLNELFGLANSATGLDDNNLDGKKFDVLWYKPNGHIIPHHDVYPNSDSSTQGRRFATFIVYLHEPTLGGATIFPGLGLAVKPKAGDAIFWYNVKVDNEPDPLLSHAGCPIWEGEKFIGTFWFRQFHQEFRQPCPLQGDRFKFA